jgi:predicted nucleic acid-binding Zn ribbon protein
MTVNTPPNVIKAFKRRKMLFNIFWYSGCILIAVGILSMRNPGTYTGLPENIEPPMMYAIGGLCLAGAIYAWRCPVCGHMFWINTRTIACGKCKTEFLPKEKQPFW